LQALSGANFHIYAASSDLSAAVELLVKFHQVVT